MSEHEKAGKLERPLLKYARSLSIEAKRRYLEKIAILDGYDPFLGVPSTSTSVVPPVDSSDIVSYLVLETSFLTAKLFKAPKGLEAYN